MTWTTVLFDLDGTLTDSGEGIKKSIAYALEELGYPPMTDKAMDVFIGPPLKDMMQELFHVSDEEAQKFVDKYRERYTGIGLYENEIYPGIRACLDSLKAQGLILGVASSKPEPMVKACLSHFGLDTYFSVIVGSTYDGVRVSKKDVIVEALKRLDVSDDKSSLIYVGDRSYDVQGARQCGLLCIGAAWGYGGFAELADNKALYIASTPAMLSDIIAEENAGQASTATKASADNQNREVGGTSVNNHNRENGGTSADNHNREVGGTSADNHSREDGISSTGPRRPAGGYAPYGRNTDELPLCLWRVLYPILLYQWMDQLVVFGVSFLYRLVGPVLYSFFGFDLMGHVLFNGDGLVLQGISAVITIPFLVWFIEKDEIKRKMGGRYRFSPMAKKAFGFPDVAGVVVLIISSCLVLSSLIAMTPLWKLDKQYQAVNQSIESASGLVVLMVVVIAAPICEELIFRGLVQARIRDYAGPKTAIVLSSLCFGLFHMNLVQGLFAFGMGLILAALYEKYGNILIPLAGHIANNVYNTVSVSLLPKGISIFTVIGINAVISGLLIWVFFFREKTKKA